MILNCHCSCHIHACAFNHLLFWDSCGLSQALQALLNAEHRTVLVSSLRTSYTTGFYQTSSLECQYHLFHTCDSLIYCDCHVHSHSFSTRCSVLLWDVSFLGMQSVNNTIFLLAESPGFALSFLVAPSCGKGILNAFKSFKMLTKTLRHHLLSGVILCLPCIWQIQRMWLARSWLSNGPNIFVSLVAWELKYEQGNSSNQPLSCWSQCTNCHIGTLLSFIRQLLM